MKRLEGWESRLAGVIEAARHERYELGVHDCFRVTCAGVEALTGIDLWKDWAGTYRTRREALRRIAEYGGTFDEAFSRLFACEPVGPAWARRGDIVKFHDGREPHLGLCVGAEVAVLGEDGLMFVPLTSCSCAWRIG